MQVRDRLFTIEEKNTLLRSSFGGGSGVDLLPRVKQSFSQFQTLLEGREIIMRDQIELMRGNVSSRTKRLADDVERLHSLWNQFKPRAEILSSDDRMALMKAVDFIREKRQQFNELEKQRDKLLADCEQFDIETPNALAGSFDEVIG